MKPKLPWYVRLILSIALKIIPKPWSEYLGVVVEAYNQLPNEDAAATHNVVKDLMKKRCEGARCPAETVSE
jgi:hypothetical protein